MIKLIDEVSAREGFMNRSDAIRRLISAGLSKVSPAYVRTANAKQERSPEAVAFAKAQATLAGADMRAEARAERGRAICHTLGGSSETENGVEYCAYQTMTEVGGGRVERGAIREPMEDLTDAAIDFQCRDLDGNSGPAARARIAELLAAN